MPDFEAIRVGERLPEREHRPTNASLFYYNASIWNAHRIHYDHQYVTEVEGYPAIVIDGPLQADWLSQVVTEWMGDSGRLVRMSSSHRQAAYLGETLRAGGEVVAKDAAAREVTLRLHIRNEKGEVITPGEAVVRFDPG
jgi:3-methylfumaryl-CoA hydratase